MHTLHWMSDLEQRKKKKVAGKAPREVKNIEKYI